MTTRETSGAREKGAVALASVIAAVVLTGAKLAVGMTTGSLGILSEAAHSGLDLASAAITLWAVRAAAHPPDRRHPYGHGKFENLSALFETLLLLATCAWIIAEGIERLFFRPAAVEVSVWAFAVMAGSIAVDYSRSRALMRVANKHKSQALEADALHFSTDIWSSSVVIAGLGAVVAAERFGIPWLAKADAMAALGVAAIVVGLSLRLGKKTVDDLLDAVPEDLEPKVVAAAMVAGVSAVHAVRLRRSGPALFVELTLDVTRAAALEKAHEIAHEAELAVRQAVSATDVVVHVEPVEDQSESVLTTVRVVAARLGLGAHAIRIYDDADGCSVELHLEVDDELRLGEAHELASRFEAELHRAVPSLRRIVTHAEPAGDTSATCRGVRDDATPLSAVLDALRAEHDLAWRHHDLQVTRVGTGLDISFHCTMARDTSIVRGHELTVQLEKELRTRVPGVGRVVIHLEPET